jgi:DnaJ homolog subfamily B member 6
MSNMERNRAASMGMGYSSFSPMRSHFGFPAFPSVAMDMGSGSGSSGWASESTMSQTINGVTHTIRKRRDWDGNEHVTRIYPDGRKVVTLNGVEQHDQGHVPPPPTNNHNNYLPSGPPPPYSATPGGVMNYDEHPIIPSYRNNPGQ